MVVSVSAAATALGLTMTSYSASTQTLHKFGEERAREKVISYSRLV